MITMRMYENSTLNDLKHLVEVFGLTNRIKDPVRKYSMGMKQRLALCRALIGSPEILLLDEPTNGLDIDGVFEFREMINKINLERGVSIIISSHILSEIEKLCNRAIIIKQGKVIGNIDMNLSGDDGAWRVFVRNPNKAKTILINAGVHVFTKTSEYVSLRTNQAHLDQICKLLEQNNIEVLHFDQGRASFEDQYIYISAHNGGPHD